MAHKKVNMTRHQHEFVCGYLPQRLQFGLHDELKLAELTAARVRAFDPLLQACLMHEAQTARAVARHDQRTFIITLAVTDPAHTHTHTQHQAHNRPRT